MSDESTDEPTGTISARVREARDHSGMTRAELSEAAGVSTPAIFRVERGDYDDGTVHVRTLGLMAAALKVSPGWLAYGCRAERPRWVKARDRRRS